MTQLTDWAMRMTTDAANVMTSVERLLDYTHIDQEASFKSNNGKNFIFLYLIELVFLIDPPVALEIFHSQIVDFCSFCKLKKL